MFCCPVHITHVLFSSSHDFCFVFQSLQDENKALKETNKVLCGLLRQSSDTDDDDESSANTKLVNTYLSFKIHS